jgi:diguanylate cyclase (GGDEF)-like protein
MRQSTSRLRTRRAGIVGSTQEPSIAQPPGLPAPLTRRTAARKVLAIDQRKFAQEMSLDQLVSSALRLEDKRVIRMLREVRELSRTPKSDAGQARSDALHRAVLGAVKQCLLDRELRSLALTDDLTGLCNRRAFYALAEQQLKVSRRKSQGLLLFFADIDDLKQINDCYGHHEGDLAIVRAADVLRQSFRDSDIIARIGGDEFVVLALEAACQSEQAILQRLEESLDAENAPKSRRRLSLSVGVARFDPQHPVSLGDLIALADNEMYREKRNRKSDCLAQP